MAIARVRVERLVESQPRALELEPDQAEALQVLGRKLVSDKTWWGESGRIEDDPELRTAIRCSSDGKQWSVTVDNAVGTVSTRDLQLIIEPKIPQRHLFYLFSKTQSWPRLDESPTPLSADESLMDLVVRWYLNAVERLLRGDLIRDYVAKRDDLDAVRGGIDAMGTAQLFYSGRLAATCDFEEFEVDTPLNRVLKAAAREIVRSPLMSRASRKRAERVDARMDDVGSLQLDDLRATVDRRTVSYRDPVVLARHILQAQGRALARGDISARAFLIRTPDLVEEGIRAILRAGMSDLVGVHKRGRQLPGSVLTINPDLRFDPLAVGDVKYKVNSNGWARPDLYQSVAFAVGFGCKHGLLVSFCDDDRDEMPAIHVGDVTVDHLLWRASSDMDCRDAENLLILKARAWWASIVGVLPFEQPDRIDYGVPMAFSLTYR
jgi:5-methylcytosine-specific restriction enzyme subunit McrC